MAFLNQLGLAFQLAAGVLEFEEKVQIWPVVPDDERDMPGRNIGDLRLSEGGADFLRDKTVTLSLGSQLDICGRIIEQEVHGFGADQPTLIRDLRLTTVGWRPGTTRGVNLELFGKSISDLEKSSALDRTLTLRSEKWQLQEGFKTSRAMVGFTAGVNGLFPSVLYLSRLDAVYSPGNPFFDKKLQLYECNVRHYSINNMKPYCRDQQK